jgi:hypothetical protein
MYMYRGRRAAAAAEKEGDELVQNKILDDEMIVFC